MKSYNIKGSITLIFSITIIFVILIFILFHNYYAKVTLAENKIALQSDKMITVENIVNPSDGASMIFIPSGFSYMGTTPSIDGLADASETGPRLVYLDDYYIYKYEVTIGQFKKFTDKTGYITTAEKKKASHNWKSLLKTVPHNHPVAFISWFDARAYSEWAGGSLPTEAQWEKAARGNTLNIYPWGNNPDITRFHNELQIGGSARDNSQYIEDGSYNLNCSKPVGSYPAGVSPYGVMDMLGNVWEWCDDWYERRHIFPEKYMALYHPRGPVTGKFKVVKGGGCCDDPKNYRVTCRDRNIPETFADDFGFRVVIYPGSLGKQPFNGKKFQPPTGTYTDAPNAVFIDIRTGKKVDKN